MNGYGPEHRHPDNEHDWDDSFYLHSELRYRCRRCGLNRDYLMGPNRQGCVALPAPAVAPPVDVSALPRVTE